MFSVIFSSRWDKEAQPHSNPLFSLLDSFESLTTEEEKGLSEFIIKFDDDDPHRPEDKEFDKYNFKIKRFTFDRLGGRYGLHFIQDMLYKQADKDVKFVQFIADDFIFARPDFVSEILEYSDQYKITGEIGMGRTPSGDYQCPVGSRGYCPAFSSKVLDALACTSGPHCNADGIATALGENLRADYGYEIMFKPGASHYYYRTDCQTSRHDGSNVFGLLTSPTECPSTKGFHEVWWKILTDCVYRAKLCDEIGEMQDLCHIHALVQEDKINQEEL